MGFLDLTSLCGFVDVFSGPANPISAISILALSSPSDVFMGRMREPWLFKFENKFRAR